MGRVCGFNVLMPRQSERGWVSILLFTTPYRRIQSSLYSGECSKSDSFNLSPTCLFCLMNSEPSVLFAMPAVQRNPGFSSSMTPAACSVPSLKQESVARDDPSRVLRGRSGADGKA